MIFLGSFLARGNDARFHANDCERSATLSLPQRSDNDLPEPDHAVLPFIILGFLATAFLFFAVRITKWKEFWR
jgi:hypothetical protein